MTGCALVLLISSSAAACTVERALRAGVNGWTVGSDDEIWENASASCVHVEVIRVPGFEGSGCSRSRKRSFEHSPLDHRVTAATTSSSTADPTAMTTVSAVESPPLSLEVSADAAGAPYSGKIGGGGGEGGKRMIVAADRTTVGGAKHSLHQSKVSLFSAVVRIRPRMWASTWSA